MPMQRLMFRRMTDATAARGTRVAVWLAMALVAPCLQPAVASAGEDTEEQAAKVKAEQESRQWIEKIRKLSFDRRPSALLGGTVDAVDSVPADSANAEDAPETQLEAFRKDVNAGRWEQVGGFLRSLPQQEAIVAADHLLEAVGKMPPAQPGPDGRPLASEGPVFTAADIVEIARALPVPIDEPRQKKLGALAKLAIDGGTEPTDLAKAVAAEVDRDVTERKFDRRAVAVILAESGRADLVDPFVPAVDVAVADKDFAGLKLRVRQLKAARDRDKANVSLDDVWKAVRGLLAIDSKTVADHRYAVEQAAELLPLLPSEDAHGWLAAVTADNPQMAQEVLAAIAAHVAVGLQKQPRDVESRTRWLKILDTAVDGITASKAAQDPGWREPLSLAARAWTAEAVHSAAHDTKDTSMKRDRFGNIFYWEEQQAEQQRQQLPQWPVKLADALDTRPDDTWLALLDSTERPAVQRAVIALHCKAGEPDHALPLLEKLAASHPETAQSLVKPMLDAWKLAHDPNDERTRPMPFFYAFGMEQRQGGIPLTRSLQERNLAALETFVERLRALPLGPLDEKLLVDCFTTCHSVAEVYKPEAIASVFGPVEQLAPTAVARLAAKMRANLAGTWQKPSVQEHAKTKRREADIRAEVIKGYETARRFITAGLARHPNHWALLGAQAAHAHDANDYEKKIADTPDFTKNRRAALDAFAAAGKAYAAATATLPRDDWQPDLLETWFLAGCGACDAGRIDETTQGVDGEIEKIRAVIDAMEPEQREWHRERFAASLVSRLSRLNPAVKYRVVRAGLEVAGDHPKAREARKVVDYYADLTREIELRADIDGSDRVGHGRPFGVLVSLRHTREIERESGGFGRYLQNQKTGNPFAFNFGRPLENYREKFEEAARKALGEFFDVKSITFESEAVQSRADAEYGWRRTPYAYLVLAAKDPKIDRLPPLRLDLDFLDTAGYVILPIESSATALDAVTESPEPRPYAKLSLTQILDDRKAHAGEVTLEVRAAARGLVPDLDELLDPAVAGFEVAHVRDDGLAVSRFDPDASEPVVLSERSWAATLKPKAGAEPATRFVFPEPKIEVAESILQRYDDADLVTAEQAVAFGGRIARRFPRWPLIAGVAGGSIALLGFLVLLWRALANPTPIGPHRFSVPEPATPFAVLQLLRDIQSTNGLDDRGHAELQDSIERLERTFFADDTAATAPAADHDLTAIAGSWVTRARPRQT
jgi:hypothetical protein